MSSDPDSNESVSAGAARTDITPDTDRTLEGFVRPDIKSTGVSNRLFAHALVLENGAHKIAIVSTDLALGFDKEDLLPYVQSLGFNRSTLLTAGTHTHAATFEGEWALSQTAKAIKQADENRVPAKLGWSSTHVDGINQSRSLEAHLANHDMELSPGEATPDMDPDGSNHPRDTTLRLLRVDTVDNDPLAILCNFSVHPTSYTPHNTVYSSDFIGPARKHFLDSLPSGSDPIVLFLNGTQGDLITEYDDYNQFALANTLGKRLSGGMVEAWEKAEGSLQQQITLTGQSSTAKYEGQEIEPGKRLAKRPFLGLPFFGGAKNGPSFFYFLGLEGLKRPECLAGDVHGRKIIVSPGPWDTTVEVQNLRVGNHLLLTVPGEPTVQMGRRVIEDTLAEADDDLEDAMIVGIANGFHGYFTTPEEYDRQHYEGGHTVFGKHTEALIRRSHANLIRNEEDNNRQDDTSDEQDKEIDNVNCPVGLSGDGSLVDHPSPTMERYEVAEVRWNGAGNGTERPVGDPFVFLERKKGNNWNEVANDLDLGFIWFIKSGTYIARYEVPGDLESGIYRFRINGTGYELTTNQFSIQPSQKLRILGAKMKSNDSNLVIFKVQNPPPDPDRNLLPREQIPKTGELRFDYEGEEYIAHWNQKLQAWTTECPLLSQGDSLKVPEGNFVDSNGNKNGDPFTIEIGRVSELNWPDDMETGGGSPPGPYGIGISTVP